ncbi:beta-phosphoglucomutase-like phosphatase (HAD superfamily) [Methylopila capsulata]|uniref:Phosphatase n=1 Tax=Methylopila capsulata TaxID=61654 RepID=A0A9W6IRF6_9HYPH|nr:HAD-IA family hydrolase [Methylopila capsulata]MBM7849836.1 beta-phosphoglucomutase-like phosphatase (HAD superfamily) [Methylopila capsulata]GLK55126.1 phosphatase [Methylopila capsulata]
MPLEALIFDVDGTLAETEETHRRALNDAFAAFDLPWSWDQPTYRRLLRIMGGKERLRHFIEHDRPEKADDALARLDELHAAKNRRYAELVHEGGVTLRPGVARLIAEAREKGLTLAIATTTSQANVEALLVKTLGPEALGWFSAIAAGDLAPAKKPAPDIFLLALRQLGLPASVCVVLEDTVYGLRAAKAAGLATLVTPSFYTDDQDFSAADAVFDTLGEPDAPALHLAGAGVGRTLVTVDVLRSLVA